MRQASEAPTCDLVLSFFCLCRDRQLESTPKTSLSGNSLRAGGLPLATSLRRFVLLMCCDGIVAKIQGLQVEGCRFESDICDLGRVVLLGGKATGSQLNLP